MEPLAAQTILVDQVYRRLVAAIADRTLHPGQRILQAELAASLGVSRQPVSHALQLLKQQKLVQDFGRKGLQISPIDPARIRQLYEVRGALDALAARLAASRALPQAAVKALEAAVAAGVALGPATSLRCLVEADIAFHQVIYDLSGNPVIPETLAGQWPHLRRSMGAVLDAGGYRQRAWSEHAEIARLILAGRPAEAGDAAQQHAIDAGRQTERRLVQENPSR